VQPETPSNIFSFAIRRPPLNEGGGNLKKERKELVMAILPYFEAGTSCSLPARPSIGGEGKSEGEEKRKKKEENEMTVGARLHQRGIPEPLEGGGAKRRDIMEGRKRTRGKQATRVRNVAMFYASVDLFGRR